MSLKECCRFKTGKCAAETNPQPLANFAKDRKRKDGVTPHCKACLKVFRDTNKEQRSETIKKWRQRHPEKMKEYRRKEAPRIRERMKRWREKNRLQFLYGLSNEQWQDMFSAQEGKCKICLAHARDLKRGLCVDHNHTTGQVRGLLCHVCNKAIGLFKENIELLDRAKMYLKASSK